MSDYNISIHSNPNAKVWAELFMETLQNNKWSIDDIDESLMHAWFASAMTAMHDHLYSTKIQPLVSDESYGGHMVSRWIKWRE